MSVSRRAEALARARGEMTGVRERILAFVGPRSDVELLAAPAAGGWCAAEVLDHLRTAEGKLLKGLLRVERGEPVRLPRRAYFYRLPMGIAFANVKLKAPGPVRPRAAAEIGSPREVIATMRTSRDELLALADRLGEERFSRFLFPHFLLGRFDGLDWFRFLARHESRHLAQLARILS
ncbi:MAG TPA: DinB family protein [Thermoanaerobaculia bacterium]|nr:DinB family protein [Thermoanaerobaculia bacterium]